MCIKGMIRMAVDRRGRKLPKGIRQRDSGYEGRVMYQGKRHSVRGNTVTEVQKKMTDLKYKLEHGLFVENNKITLDQWLNTWLDEYKKNTVKLGTFLNYQKSYNGMIKDKLGSKRIADIRGEHIQKMYNDWVKEEYALSTIKIASAILNGCMEQALINGMIERNPVKLAKVPRQNEKKVRQAMTREQQALFMEYAKESYLYNFFAIMLRTGLRNGEMRGLKYTDIDKKNKVLHVQRTLKYIDGQGYIEDTPKTKTSRRDIPLTDATLQLLDEQKNYWGFKIVNLDRYLFCNEKGEPLSRDRVQAEINRIIMRIRKGGNDFERITAHVFRHTFATRAIEAGMQPQVLKTILGHSSLAMTMDLYSHVLPDTKAEEMEKIVNAF